MTDEHTNLQRTIDLGLAVLRKEARAIEAAAQRLGPAFAEAVNLLLNCRGRVAVTGMGKAGQIGAKIQATLSSTATAAYFLHPVEALHGDLGMIQPDDVVIALSRSGENPGVDSASAVAEAFRLRPDHGHGQSPIEVRPPGRCRA